MCRSWLRKRSSTIMFVHCVWAWNLFEIHQFWQIKHYLISDPRFVIIFHMKKYSAIVKLNNLAERSSNSFQVHIPADLCSCETTGNGFWLDISVDRKWCNSKAILWLDKHIITLEMCLIWRNKCSLCVLSHVSSISFHFTMYIITHW